MLCLDDNGVLAFLGGAVPAPERATIEAHLDSCGDCLELVTLLSKTSLAAHSDALATHDGEPALNLERRQPLLAPGSHIGRYEIVEVRGSGGMGVVYAARDPQLDRMVAIKLVNPNAVDIDTRRLRLQLLREAQAMARITQPNVLTVYDMGTFEEQVFLAAELVNGETLDAWLSKTRPWRQIVATFVQAGRGLEAAHLAGLVHRDFKPQNVLVGADGRVRVFDFGLVRFDESFAESGRHVVGTPLYMAPEQHRGDPADASADQFAFCVALFEALYGRRPFAGRSSAELYDHILAGNISQDASWRVPRWLDRIVRRGLRAAPSERFPSIRELLGAIDRGLRRRRRHATAALAAGGVVAALGAAALGYSEGTREPESRCPEPSLAGVWDDARRAAVQAAFRATGLPYAETSWQTVERQLDGFASRWRGQQREVCLAFEVHATQDRATRDRRLACLEQRVLLFGAVIDRLVESDAKTVIQAATAVGGLPSLDICAQMQAIEKIELPADAATRAGIEAAWKDTARITSLLLAGKVERAGEGIDALVGSARALGYRPAEADALFVAGQTRIWQGKLDEAVKHLQDALWTATAIGYDELVAAAASDVVRVIGAMQGKDAESRPFRQLALAASERLAAPAARARALRAAGFVDLVAGRFQDAEQSFVRAVELEEAANGPESFLVAAALTDLANLYVQRGQSADAEKVQRRALAILTAQVGAGHPATGTALNNLANTMAARGRYAEAATLYEQAMAVREQALGPEHAEVAQTLNNAAAMAIMAGDLARGRKALERALAIYEKTLGAEHASTTDTLNNLAEVARLEGDLDAATKLHLRTLEVRRRLLGEHHPRTATSLFNLGGLALERGDVREAETWCQRARTALEASDANDRAFLAEVSTCLGEVALARGKLPAARAILERALALYPPDGAEPGSIAETRFALARALTADVPRALELARAARDAFAADAVFYRRELAQVDAWLQGRAR